MNLSADFPPVNPLVSLALKQAPTSSSPFAGPPYPSETLPPLSPHPSDVPLLPPLLPSSSSREHRRSPNIHISLMWYWVIDEEHPHVLAEHLVAVVITAGHHRMQPPSPPLAVAGIVRTTIRNLHCTNVRLFVLGTLSEFVCSKSRLVS
ncbi:hypothetical protein PIB30_057682 [Stylosanthes scabra]|uniref:Uncharacterized protein n=1 Tax=Stylosanthes scabra TaxID=79078 RepID=A0ABU6TKL6_9FABA|nr:hypothetical protein [Stylosanthes scabra]